MGSLESKQRHLVLVFWNLGIGGIQTRMKDLVERLAKEEIRVTILVDRRLDQEIVLPESNLLSIISFRDERYKVLRRPFKRLERFRFPWWLYSQIDQLRPTQVLAFLNRFSVYCVVIRWLLRLKGVNFRLVLNEGILTSKYLNQYERFYWRYLVRWFYRGADRIIVPTVAVKIDLIRNFSVPGKLIIVVPSWVPGEIRPTKTVKKYDGIYAGRISPEKGINTLVHLGEMIRKNKLTFRLALVGEGPLSEWLKEVVKKEKLEKIVIYLGFKIHDETLKLIGSSRLLLLPSVNEGLPMTVLEANALGVPVAVMPFRGAAEVVEEGENGVILNKDNYCTRVINLFNKNNSLREMGNRAQLFVKKHYSKKNLERFVEVLMGEVNET